MSTSCKILCLSIVVVLFFRAGIDGQTWLRYSPPVSYPNKSQTAPPRNNALIRKKTTSIYLTIDDGPSPASFYLSNKAMADSIYLTMFVIGDSVFKNSSNKIFFDLYQLNPFIEIGNHSYSHANGHYRLYYKDSAKVIADFLKNADTLHNTNMIARLPGRNTWRINGRAKTDLADDSSSANGLLRINYRVFGWDIEWTCKTDSVHGIENADSVIAAVDRMNIKGNSFTPGNIVLLCHESMFVEPANRIQFERLIKRIKQNPLYQMKFLSQYPVIRNHFLN